MNARTILFHPISPGSRTFVTALQNCQGAVAPNTFKAWFNDFKQFMSWYQAYGYPEPPNDPEAVAGFLHAMAEQRACATVRRYLASLTAIYRLMGINPNPGHSVSVKLALRKIQRTKGVRQLQARALTWDTIAEVLPLLGDSLRGVRDKALVLLAYDTLCRRSELIALRVEDIRMNDQGDGSILVRKSKTDQDAQGHVRYLSKTALMHLNVWMSFARIDSGPLLRAVYNDGTIGGALSAEGVNRALKRIAEHCGITGVSGHSCRIGAAQDMVATGNIDLAAVMQAGGWASPRMPARYTEHLAASRGGMAHLAKKQGR